MKNLLSRQYQEMIDQTKEAEMLIYEYRFLDELSEPEELKRSLFGTRDFDDLDRTLTRLRTVLPMCAERFYKMSDLLVEVGLAVSPLTIDWVRQPLDKSEYSRASNDGADWNVAQFGEVIPALKNHLWASVADTIQMPDELSAKISVWFFKAMKLEAQQVVHAVQTARNGISTHLCGLTGDEIVMYCQHDDFSCDVLLGDEVEVATVKARTEAELAAVEARMEAKLAAAEARMEAELAAIKARTEMRQTALADLLARARVFAFDIGSEEHLMEKVAFEKEEIYRRWYLSCEAQLERVRVVDLFCQAASRHPSDLLLNYVADGESAISVEEALKMLSAGHCERFGIDAAAMQFVFQDDPENLVTNTLLIGNLMQEATDSLGDDIIWLPLKLPERVTILLQQRKGKAFLNDVLKRVEFAKRKNQIQLD